MTLTDVLTKERIVLNLEDGNKEGIIAKLVDLVVNGYDRETVLNAIMEREKLGSTGIGHGVALPHVRLDAVDAAVVAFGRSANAIDFDAIDEEPCSLFFLILGPSRQNAQEAYLQTMAKISRLLRNEEVRQGLLAAPSAEDVLKLIADKEA